MGVLCRNKHTYLYGLPLVERMCESVMDLMYSAYGLGGGGIVLESFHTTYSYHVEWRMNEIVTHVYFK